MSQLAKPHITLDKSEVVKGNDILDIFKCYICGKIPIDPIMQCSKCDSI